MDIQAYFKEGTRIQIGVSMIDGSGGNLLKSKVDVWIDITHWDIALQGQAMILHGMIESKLLAAITHDVLYGSVQVELRFVRGRVEVWIYKDGKKTKVAGRGSIEFGLRKGCIKDGRFIDIPWKSFWLGAGAKFGEFTNGKSGICGWVDVPVFGSIGAFVSYSGNLSLGSMSSYKLDVPGNRVDSRALGIASGGPVRSVNPAPGEINENVYYYDRNRWNGESPRYSFSVPGAARRTAPGGLNSRSMLRSSSEKVSVEKVERIIFAVGYEEGCPSVRAVSPSGQIFTAESAKVTAMYIDDGYVMAVVDPEPGQWTIHID
ncbi:MAG: hypothetical protein MI749_09575, partial [Desulfovibrionales bacterium]|nr:hypothetical protein [Desulfovibrionales bacterium]